MKSMYVDVYCGKLGGIGGSHNICKSKAIAIEVRQNSLRVLLQQNVCLDIDKPAKT